MEWFLEQSNYLSFTLVCIITVGLSLLGLMFVRKRFPHEKIKDNHDTASVIFNAYGLLYAVMVAFVVYVTWGTYDTATKDVEMEANQLMNLYYTSQAYPDSVSKDLQKKLLNYTDDIYNVEWQQH